jgi:hypothetical protein
MVLAIVEVHRFMIEEPSKNFHDSPIYFDDDKIVISREHVEQFLFEARRFNDIYEVENHLRSSDQYSHHR